MNVQELMAGGAALQPFRARRAVRADPHTGPSALEQASISAVATVAAASEQVPAEAAAAAAAAATAGQ
jgi:hypothetical protein